MSIIMDWSRSSTNGAVAHPNNQQYLQQSTSSTASTLPNCSAYVTPNSYSTAQTLVTNSASSKHILKRLLHAKSNDEISKIQQMALIKTAGEQTTQVSTGQYNASFSSLHAMATSCHSVQNPVVSNYQIQVYPNPVLQSLQLVPIVQQPVLIAQQQAQPVLIAQQQGQPMSVAQQQGQPVSVAQQQGQPVSVAQQQAQLVSVAQQQAQPVSVAQQQAQPVSVAQQQAPPDQFFGANRYKTRESQQLQQITQSGAYLKNKMHKQLPNLSTGKRCVSNVPITSWSITPPPVSPTIYSVPNGSNGSSYKPQALQDTNISVLTANYQNGQNIQNPMGSNYQSNTLQPQRDMANYVQSPQRNLMQSLHSAYANNSSNVLPSATVGQMPSSYPQSNSNTSSVYNVSVNQRLSHPNQNLVTQNVQQSVQSHSVAQDQPSAAVQPPPYNIAQYQRLNAHEILALLKVYRDVKQKYLLLNRENILLRQKMQSSAKNNSGFGAMRPPLISALLTSTVPTNDPIGVQEVPQNSTEQSRPPSNTPHAVQTPTLYDNSVYVPMQKHSQLMNSFSGHDVRNQRHYTGLDCGQMNPRDSVNSSGQALGSETIRNQDPQENSMVSNNQYLSTGNSRQGNLLQNGMQITSTQSLAQTTASSEHCNPVPTANAQNFNSLTFSSREAIKASLPLWKSVSQGPAQNKSGYQEQRQHVVDNGLETVHLLDDITSNSISEPNAFTLTQKSEHSTLNVSKGVEPQIAIVPPLVQDKSSINEFNQCPKVVPQGKDLTNNGLNVLEEIDSFNKILLALKAVDNTASLNNPEDVQSRSSMVSSFCSMEVASNDNVDQKSIENINVVDDGLQISGICTLVEGNSFYDSSIAMMFEGSSQIPSNSPLQKTDTLQGSKEDINICEASPTTEMEAVKSEPQEITEPLVNVDDQQRTDVIYEIPPEKTSDVLDEESDTVSDQLSELMTEFPSGIENYMSERKPNHAELSLGKFTGKTEILKTFSCKSDWSIKDTQTKYAMDTSIKLESPSIEDTKPSVIERVPIPELPTDEATFEQMEEEEFEISDSPDVNIQLTLLDPDQFNKIFQEDSTKQESSQETTKQEPSQESLLEDSGKESVAPVVDGALSSIKEKSNEKIAPAPDKKMFCCLFGWLTHTNGNAPKCNCKLTELGKTKELANALSQHTAVITTEPSADVFDPSRADKPPPDGLEPAVSHPCKMELDKHDETLPPVLKRPKIEPTEKSVEGEHFSQIMNFSQPKEIQVKEALSEKYHHDVQSREEQRKIDTLTNEKIFQSSHLGEQNRKERKEPSTDSKSKVEVLPKLGKLIIRTDFMKNKHSHKIKRKYKETKMSVEEGGTRDVKKSKKTIEVGESANTHNMYRIVSNKESDKYKVPASTVKQSERSMNKLKSSSSDKSRFQAPPLDKRKGRHKSRPESHYEKVRKVPSVQQYLEKRRESYNKTLGTRLDPRYDPSEVRHRVVEKPSMERQGNNLLAQVRRPSSPAKISARAKNMESEAINQIQKAQPGFSGVSASQPRRHSSPSGSHGRASLGNTTFSQKSTSSKEKIYLMPCDGSRSTQFQGISLAKLQIRCSPEKTEHYDRRKSRDSSVHSKRSKSETTYKETPKMLEFKLCPEFIAKSPTTQERKGELKVAKEKQVIEGIKSNKEAWCTGVPAKKSWIGSSSEEQGGHSPSASSSSKKNSRPVHDSQTTFNVFRQMYHEKRSKSLDSSL